MSRQTRATTVVSQPPQPALLDRVIRLVDRAEHPEGQRAQVPAVGLELVGQHVVSVHCHILR